MPASKDPTKALKDAAAKLPDVVAGTSCNQTSFKAGKTAFLYVGPGPKGVGFKAMFKLGDSLDEAASLAKKEPERFGLGSGSWVSTRFSAEEPLPKTLWSRWLKESHAAVTQGGPKKKAAKKPAVKKAASRKVAKKKSAERATKNQRST